MFKEMVKMVIAINLQLLSIYFFSMFCQEMDSEDDICFFLLKNVGWQRETFFWKL